MINILGETGDEEKEEVVPLSEQFSEIRSWQQFEVPGHDDIFFSVRVLFTDNTPSRPGLMKKNYLRIEYLTSGIGEHDVTPEDQSDALQAVNKLVSEVLLADLRLPHAETRFQIVQPSQQSIDELVATNVQ